MVSGTTTLIFSNKKLNDTIKIIKSLEDSALLTKSVTETVKNEEKGGFLGTLLGTLGASLLANMVAGKRVIKGGDGVIQAGERTNRVGRDF